MAGMHQTVKSRYTGTRGITKVTRHRKARARHLPVGCTALLVLTGRHVPQCPPQMVTPPTWAAPQPAAMVEAQPPALPASLPPAPSTTIPTNITSYLTCNTTVVVMNLPRHHHLLSLVCLIIQVTAAPLVTCLLTYLLPHLLSIPLPSPSNSLLLPPPHMICASLPPLPTTCDPLLPLPLLSSRLPRLQVRLTILLHLSIFILLSTPIVHIS